MKFRRFGAPFGRLPSGGTRSPSAALRFYTVPHALVHRLEKYQATDVARPFRRVAWSDLVYWQMLLDGDDEGIARLAGADPDAYIPTPEEWFSEHPAPA